jgi:hypothetical protein
MLRTGLASDWINAESDKYRARLAAAEKVYLDKAKL